MPKFPSSSAFLFFFIDTPTTEIYTYGHPLSLPAALPISDGYLLIGDRPKDMISVGGFKVFPSQIEAVLYRHAAVREALAIAVPDDYSGERPKAFVTLNEDAKIDGEELKTWQIGRAHV